MDNYHSRKSNSCMTNSFLLGGGHSMRGRGLDVDDDHRLGGSLRIWSACLLVFLQAVITFQGRSNTQAQEASTHEARRPVTVGDCIRMTKFGDPSYWYGVPSAGLVAKFSPDGRKFLVVLRRGNIEQNTNDYSLLLWKT